MTIKSKMVTLNPGESKIVSIGVTPTVAKTYQVSVDGLTGSFEAVAVFDPWSYDFNGDGYINNEEATKAVQDYFAGIITKEQVEQVLALPSPPALAGIISPGLIWHEPLTNWEEALSSKGIPLNEEIHLAPVWVNKSDINIAGHMELSVTYPDGTRAFLSAVLNQDKEAAPGNGWSVQFAPFLSTQEGTYTLEATLFSGGQVLDSVTFTLVTIAAALPFTFSNFSARKIVCPGATAFGAVEINSVITNPNNVPVTQDVAIMWSRYSRTYSQWIDCDGKFGGGTRYYCVMPMSNCGSNPFPITLQPGESMNFFYAGFCSPDPNDPSFQPCDPLLPKNYDYYFWLEDSLGNKSSETKFSN